MKEAEKSLETRLCVLKSWSSSCWFSHGLGLTNICLGSVSMPNVGLDLDLEAQISFSDGLEAEIVVATFVLRVWYRSQSRGPKFSLCRRRRLEKVSAEYLCLQLLVHMCVSVCLFTLCGFLVFVV